MRRRPARRARCPATGRASHADRAAPLRAPWEQSCQPCFIGSLSWRRDEALAAARGRTTGTTRRTAGSTGAAHAAGTTGAAVHHLHLPLILFDHRLRQEILELD